MPKIAKEQIDWLLGTFKSDSTNTPDFARVREKELADSPVSGCRWFINGNRMTTANGRSKDKRYGIYKNSFSKQRTLFDEVGKLPVKEKEAEVKEEVKEKKIKAKKKKTKVKEKKTEVKRGKRKKHPRK